MPLIVIKYSELTTVSGAAVVGLAWNKVPLSKIVRDDNNNCVLNLNNSFTISNKIYPKILKIKTKVTAVNVPAAINFFKTRLSVIKGAVATVIDTSLNFKVLAGENQALVDQLLTYSLNESTTFKLELYAQGNAVFGRPVGDGSEERYASVEILIE